MDDTINHSEELENGTTTNVAEVAEQKAPATEAVESTPTDTKSTLRDAVLKAFEKTSGTEAEAAPAVAPTAEPAKEIDPITGRELEPIRAPSTMTSLLREKWGSVPREMQKFWVDRERDMQIKMQDTAEERKLAKEFQQAVAPYEAMFKQHNTNAVAHTKELLNLDHQLRSGTPAEKAQIIHSLITHFNPDVQTLVALAKGAPMLAAQLAQETPNVQEVVRQEFAAREEAEQVAAAQREMAAFQADPKNEFFDDLKPIMLQAIHAGFIPDGPLNEVFRKAYDFAADQHPEIKQILAGRAAATAPAQATMPAAKPIQSVKPSLASGGRGGPTQPRAKSLRDAVNMAYDKHVGK
jgi:hypothetical protein